VNTHGIEAWQLSILITAAIVLVEAAVNAVLRRQANFVLHKRVRTGALGALVGLTVIVFVAALGPSLADELSSVAAAVAAVVALWLTYRSYHSSHESDLSGTGEPATPPAAPSPTPEPAPTPAPQPAPSAPRVPPPTRFARRKGRK
jgi:purine-cytosine permease-like protein